MNDFLWMLKPISERRWKIREKAILIDAKRAGVKNVYRTKRATTERRSRYNFYIGQFT
ncbi:hypothetical protein OAA25_00500 [bacterium]|jgi:hypothetical protein|nr:hypothetical protein [bacterium]